MPTMPTVIVPDLDHDKLMSERYGHEVGANGRLERRIVAALCAHLAARGWLPVATNDGDEWIDTSDTKSVMEQVFNLDLAWVRFAKEGFRTQRIFLVMGNGTDILSDYTCGVADFNEAIDSFNTEDYA